MILTHPIQADLCKQWIGRPVCAVLHDGTEHIGILSRVEGGKLFLNDTSDAGVSASKAAKSGPKAPGKKGKAAASVTSLGHPPFVPHPPHPFLGPALALDLTAIALLFLLLI